MITVYVCTNFQGKYINFEIVTYPAFLRLYAFLKTTSPLSFCGFCEHVCCMHDMAKVTGNCSVFATVICGVNMCSLPLYKIIPILFYHFVSCTTVNINSVVLMKASLLLKHIFNKVFNLTNVLFIHMLKMWMQKNTPFCITHCFKWHSIKKFMFDVSKLPSGYITI